jgi:hypothetical protein
VLSLDSELSSVPFVTPLLVGEVKEFKSDLSDVIVLTSASVVVVEDIKWPIPLGPAVAGSRKSSDYTQ